MSGKSILWTAAVLAAVGCSPAPVADSPSLEPEMSTRADGAVTLVSLNVPNMH